MKPFTLRRPGWRQSTLAVLTLLVVVVLASHPELRLLLPLIDVLGLDLLLLLMGAQLLDRVRPWLVMLQSRVLRPAAVRTCRLLLFFLGIAGPPVDVWVSSSRFARIVVA
jgi:hypothetical protein